MAQAFLLRDVFHFPGVVTRAPVADRHAGEIGGYEFPDFLVAVARPNLINRERPIHKRHQVRRRTTDAPACIVGVDHGLFFHRFPQFTITFADNSFALFGGVLRDRALCQPYTSQLFHDLRRFPHRDTVNIVKNVCQCFHSRPHAVRGSTMQPRRNIGVLTP